METGMTGNHCATKEIRKPPGASERSRIGPSAWGESGNPKIIMIACLGSNLVAKCGKKGRSTPTADRPRPESAREPGGSDPARHGEPLPASIYTGWDIHGSDPQYLTIPGPHL